MRLRRFVSRARRLRIVMGGLLATLGLATSAVAYGCSSFSEDDATGTGEAGTNEAGTNETGTRDASADGRGGEAAFAVRYVKTYGAYDASADAGASITPGAISVSAGGGATIAGAFGGADIDLGGGTLSYFGKFDAFLLAVDQGGNLRSSTRFGDESSQVGACALASGTDQFVGLQFEGSLSIGVNLHSTAGTFNSAIGRYSTSAVTSVDVKGPGNVLVKQLAPDIGGGVVIIGDFTSTVAVGSSSESRSGPGSSIFLARVMRPSNVQNDMRKFGENDRTAIGGAVATNPLGRIVMTGRFGDRIDFGNGYLLTASADNDAFVASLDATLKTEWATTVSGLGNQEGLTVAAVGTEDFIVGGAFSGTFVAGDAGTPVASAGTGDIFVVRYGAKGNVVWAKTFGSAGADKLTAIAVDANGNVFLTGTFQGPSIGFGGPMLVNAGAGVSTTDLFVAWLDPKGNHVASSRLGGVGNEVSGGIGVDSAGDLTIAGAFSSSFKIGDVALTPVGQQDMFVIKLAR